MKKIYVIILSFLLVVFAFFGCAESDRGKIAMIVLKTYGTIKPVDIYEIKDGYMTTTGELDKRKTYELGKKYNYCAYQYKAGKNTTGYEYSFLKVENKLKISVEYVAPQNLTFKPTTPRILYYSEYWGEKENVLFVSRIQFYKTLHITLQEKRDSYKITYYNCITTNDSICFNDMKRLDDYKKVIEVPKSDLKKVEYIS